MCNLECLPAHEVSQGLVYSSDSSSSQCMLHYTVDPLLGALYSTKLRSRLLIMSIPMTTIHNRRFNINTTFSSASILRRRGRIKVLSQQSTINSNSSNLTTIRLLRILLSLHLNLRVSNQNHVIRGRSQQVIHRHTNRQRTLLLPTKRTRTTFTRSNIVAL